LKNKYLTAGLLVTGHSLGGAEAGLAAIDLQLIHGREREVHLYTYGSPRIGNEALADYANSLLKTANMRAVYMEDPVPTLPGHFMGFHHIGTEVHFYSPDKYLVYPRFTDDYPDTGTNATYHSGYERITGTDVIFTKLPASSPKVVG